MQLKDPNIKNREQLANTIKTKIQTISNKLDCFITKDDDDFDKFNIATDNTIILTLYYNKNKLRWTNFNHHYESLCKQIVNTIDSFCTVTNLQNI